MFKKHIITDIELEVAIRKFRESNGIIVSARGRPRCVENMVCMQAKSKFVVKSKVIKYIHELSEARVR